MKDGCQRLDVWGVDNGLTLSIETISVVITSFNNDRRQGTSQIIKLPPKMVTTSYHNVNWAIKTFKDFLNNIHKLVFRNLNIVLSVVISFLKLNILFFSLSLSFLNFHFKN